MNYNNTIKIIGRKFPPQKLLNALALLICYGAGSLASRLTRAGAFSAAAVFRAFLQVCLIDSYNVLQREHLFQKYLRISLYFIITHIRLFFKGILRFFIAIVIFHLKSVALDIRHHSVIAYNAENETANHRSDNDKFLVKANPNY